ncbi:hypothetical protein EVAR_31878_1 [Eumeta japonica]|uniref:Uncharacterized protein n=1 Tax=Eumeta variegata TaxID=151549 RepID=A0A4C1WVA3_EUMVA|nr:hypothetical protein EVAR_31878_1 [Eumeta japonica]
MSNWQMPKEIIPFYVPTTAVIYDVSSDDAPDEPASDWITRVPADSVSSVRTHKSSNVLFHDENLGASEWLGTGWMLLTIVVTGMMIAPASIACSLRCPVIVLTANKIIGQFFHD